jgi:hypothetical protein
MPAFIIQRGKLNGAYRTTYSTDSHAAAWRAYFHTHIKKGEKKRIQEYGRTLKTNKEYWT